MRDKRTPKDVCGEAKCQDVLGLQSYPGYHRFFSRAAGIFGRPKPAVTDFKTQVFRLKPVVQKREYEHG